MSHLRRLRLSGKRLTDNGIRALSLLTDLTELWLRDVVMTDHGLAALSTLKVLQFLDIRNSRITDLGIQTANLSTTLESLDLSGTSVTDKALPCIAQLTGLKISAYEALAFLTKGFAGLKDLCISNRLMLIGKSSPTLHLLTSPKLAYYIRSFV